MWANEKKSFTSGRHYRQSLLRQLWHRIFACGSRVQLAFIFIVVVLTWWIRSVVVCGDIFDGDCWMGARVTMVETSKLGSHYDPDAANKAIMVYDFAGVRSLKFGSLTSVRQSTAVIGDPNIFTMPIACHIAAAILVLCPAPPARVLIFGMGGGMLVAFIQKNFPSAFIDVVDLEPEVVRLAIAHFNVRSTALLNVTISDGRRWVDAAAAPAGGLPAGRRYDLVIQDACAGHPCTLVTAEAYAALARRAMPPGGVFVQNLFGASPRVVRTMQDIFSPLYMLDTGFSSKVLIGIVPPAAGPAQAAPQRPPQDPGQGSNGGGGGGGGGGGAVGAVSAAEAAGRARFLRDLGVTPRCFVYGLRRGQTDDVASIFERRFSPAAAPLLAAPAIRDSDPEVLALERQRWDS